ncbi:hypothetical protein D9M68_910150 [compost metagenome]
MSSDASVTPWPGGTSGKIPGSASGLFICASESKRRLIFSALLSAIGRFLPVVNTAGVGFDRAKDVVIQAACLMSTGLDLKSRQRLFALGVEALFMTGPSE